MEDGLNEVMAMVKSEIAKMLEKPEDTISETQSLSDMGLDSLQALQLLVLLERAYRIHIPEEDIAKFTTVTDVAQVIHSFRARAVGGAVLS